MDKQQSVLYTTKNWCGHPVELVAPLEVESKVVASFIVGVQYNDPRVSN